MPIRHAEWRVRSRHVINFSSYTRAAREMSSSAYSTSFHFAFLMLCRQPIPAAVKHLIRHLYLWWPIIPPGFGRNPETPDDPGRGSH
jgi:hypothetical protein